MTDMKASYAQMSDTANKLRSHKEEIDIRLSQCKVIVESLTSNDFVTREASGKYTDTHREFNDAAKKVIENLTPISQWLDRAVEALRRMDSELSSSLQRP